MVHQHHQTSSSSKYVGTITVRVPLHQ